MSRKEKNPKLEGFSLMELIVTMGILLLMAMVVFPVTIQKAQEQKLQEYAKGITNDILYQQQRSSLKGIEGGISFATGSYTLFDGPSLAGSTETQVKDLPNNISVEEIALTSGNEILFLEGEFKPNVYGSITLTDGYSQVRIEINSEGLCYYETL